MATVRHLVRGIQREVRTGDLLPERAAELLMQATALLGNVADEIREADMAYAHVLLRELETNAKANRARIRAECSTEFQRRQEARDVKELVVEICRSLKYFLRVKEEELRLTR